MVKKSGSLMYVPSDVRIELDQIKIDDMIDSTAEAFRKLTKYSRIGREAKRRKIL